MKIARFDKRIFAWVIDEVIPCTLGLILFIVFNKKTELSPTIFLNLLESSIIAYILYIALTSISSVLTNGFTLGAAILGIRVLRVDGKSLKFKDTFLKSVVEGVIPFCVVNAIYMLVIHTERSVFDRLTNTVVAEHRHAKD